MKIFGEVSREGAKGGREDCRPQTADCRLKFGVRGLVTALLRGTGHAMMGKNSLFPSEHALRSRLPFHAHGVRTPAVESGDNSPHSRFISADVAGRRPGIRSWYASVLSLKLTDSL